MRPSCIARRAGTACIIVGPEVAGWHHAGFSDRLYLYSGYLAGAFMVAIFVLMMVLSAGRPVGLNIPAADDFVSWCMAAMAFLGLAHTFRNGEMIRVGLLIDKLPEKAGTGSNSAVSSSASASSASSPSRLPADPRFLAVRRHVAGRGAVPMWIPQIGYAAGLVILLIAFVDEFIHVCAATCRATRSPSRRPPRRWSSAPLQSGV